MIKEDRFVPCTREIAIGGGVVYRPLRSWHTGAYAGEGLKSVQGDSSGCVSMHPDRRYMITTPPSTYMHRLYWHVDRPDHTVSAFLSYPNGMGCCDEYFWENNIGDCERFTGPTAEQDCEASILAELTK